MQAKNKNDAANFRVYVADVGAYASGRLAGGWVSPADYDSVDELREAIAEQLGNGDTDWALHDYESVRVGEHESPEVLIAIARACEEWGCEKVQAAIDHGIAADLEDIGEAMGEHDGGEFASPEDWANEYISSCYDLDRMLGNLACYFDYRAFARDAELGGDVSFVRLSNGNVWVVNRH